jgi:hypothetical protein
MTVTDLVETYLGVWNERNGRLRQAAIDQLLTEDSVYSDPDWEAVVGREGINELVTKAQDKFGDLGLQPGPGDQRPPRQGAPLLTRGTSTARRAQRCQNSPVSPTSAK